VGKRRTTIQTKSDERKGNKRIQKREDPKRSRTLLRNKYAERQQETSSQNDHKTFNEGKPTE